MNLQLLHPTDLISWAWHRVLGPSWPSLDAAPVAFRAEFQRNYDWLYSVIHARIGDARPGEELWEFTSPDGRYGLAWVKEGQVTRHSVVGKG